MKKPKNQSSPAAEAKIPTAISSYPPATLLRRLLAIIYDTFLITAVLFCTLAVYVVIAVSLSGDFQQATEVANNDILYKAEPTDLGWPIYPLLLSVYIGFFIYFWRATGQTLGMQVWKIKLVSCDGKVISRKQGLQRIVVATFSALFLGVGYWIMLFNQDKTTAHDKLSNTRVVSIKG